MPTTRAAVARQLEDNLKATLLELKKCKETNEQLLREREDSEKEVLQIVNKNKQLKSEMAEMHHQLLDIAGERDRLQCIVDNFDRDGSAFEDSLGRIVVLGKELHEAHNEIASLKSTIDSMKSDQTQSLFEELVTPPASSALSLPPTPQDPVVTIDLTCDTSIITSEVTSFYCSENKLKNKSIVKLKNYIKKTQTLIRRNNSFCKNVTCSQERLDLIEEIKTCTVTLEKNRENYDCDTRRLQSEMDTLKNSLQSISNKYESARKEIREHVLAMNSLLESCKYNNNQTQVLTHNQCDCKKTPSDCSAPAVCPVEQHSSRASDQLTLTQAPAAVAIDNTAFSLPAQTLQQSNIVMYSDELGKHMGLQLSQCMGRAITNHCMPGATYSCILKSVLASHFPKNTIIIILIGRRGNATKKDYASYLNKLYSMDNVKKIVLFAFPYSHCKSENYTRHCYNQFIHTLTCRNSTKLHFMDTNIFIGKYFNVTNDRYYLSKFYIRQIAKLLSYYILNSANLLANQTLAPIEHSTSNNNNIQPLESVPSILN